MQKISIFATLSALICFETEALALDAELKPEEEKKFEAHWDMHKKSYKFGTKRKDMNEECTKKAEMKWWEAQNL